MSVLNFTDCLKWLSRVSNFVLLFVLFCDIRNYTQNDCVKCQGMYLKYIVSDLVIPSIYLRGAKIFWGACLIPSENAPSFLIDVVHMTNFIFVHDGKNKNSSSK